MSNELFERFVEAHGLDKAGKSAVLPVGCRRATERRLSVRVAFGKRAQIRRDSGSARGTWATVMVKDISQSGLGFLSDDAVPIGETFLVRLPQRDGRLIRVRCVARRCEPGGFGGVAFLVGATFEQVIEEPSIRVNDNDDDQHKGAWDDPAEGANPVRSAQATHSVDSVAKTGRTGFVRAAVNLWNAVDPIRHAAQWVRRRDDFNSN